MATAEEVRAFQQHCSNMMLVDEIARGLDAVKHLSTLVNSVTEHVHRSMWQGISQEHRTHIKDKLRERLISEVLNRGHIPTSLPTIDVIEPRGTSDTFFDCVVKIVAAVRSRPGEI